MVRIVYVRLVLWLLVLIAFAMVLWLMGLVMFVIIDLIRLGSMGNADANKVIILFLDSVNHSDSLTIIQ